MNKFKYYFILMIAVVSLFSCSKNSDSLEIVPLRDFAEQYATDNSTIEEYLKSNYITVIDNPGQVDDQDVTFTKIPVGGTQPSIWSYLNSSTFPKLLSREVALHDITYTVYYLVLREGTGASPTNVDSVLASYKGGYLGQVTVSDVSSLALTYFEEVKYPQQMFNLTATIRGWGEIFPKFKTGTYVSNGDGTVTYNDFGAGVLFIPSGLAYYNSIQSSIPSYSPLVFSIKLYEIKREDQDADGIPSYLEDIDGDGYLYSFASGIVNPDDTDKDGIPDFLDADDDGDGYSTKIETKKPNGSNLSLDGPSLYYPYDPIISNPSKSTDEKRGVPSYTGDYTSPNRLRLHLDKDHHSVTQP
jgi:hypothetical protein